MRDLDLLLVNVGGTAKKVYQDLSKEISAIEPPFWAALTAGFIRNKGYNVEIVDANAENLGVRETAEIVVKKNPYLTNIVVYGQHPSASTQLMTDVGILCDEIKKINSEQKIILTGLHPSALPERTLREENCDFVCEGEGFYTTLGLLEKQQLKNIPGLWWKENKNIFHNPRAKNIQNLTSELNEVAWDLLPMNKYRAHNWQCLDDLSSRQYYASLSTSLGCPFRCDFCSIHKTFGERAIRYWKPEWVVEQIAHLNEKYNTKIFKIIDEMFVLNPKHYTEIADGLIKKGLGDEINIWAYARVDTVREGKLETLRKAGVKWLCLGFESGNEGILRDVHKGNFTRQDMIKISDEIRKHDINILANYMFGFPNDNLKTMQETLDLALEQNCEFANFYCAVAWPGSLLYEQAISQGQKMPGLWKDYAQHAYGFIPLATNYLSSEQVLKFRDDAFQTFFTSPKYLDMIEKKFGAEARKHIEKMTKIGLKRKILGD